MMARKYVRHWIGFAIWTALAAEVLFAASDEVAPGLTMASGAINGACLRRGGKTLVVYGDPSGTWSDADTVLFTHHRRDVVCAGRALVERGAKAVVPAKEIGLFTGVNEFWAKFKDGRFHDYGQQTTKVLSKPLAVSRTVKGGEAFGWEDVTFQVLDTPGYTRGAVTYVAELGGKKVAFTGDLIYGDGRLWDLYSLQDAIPEAKIGGYHGYAARLADVISSLERLAAAQPDLLIPARGPVIREPAKAIESLTRRIRALYDNYLSIDALRWYFKDEHILAKARRVLGPQAKVDWMEMAETVQEKLPAWIVPISNSRLIQAADGSGFLIDCGSPRILNELKKRHSSGTLKSLDHIFITHYHDDHTDCVPDLMESFGTTVYACREMIAVLENPEAYRLPAMTSHPIPVSARLADGATWRWKEFEMTAYYYPGQTLYHQAILVRKEAGESVCFIGDSFTPSGIDDYCLPNRNFLHAGTGYFYCLDRLKQLPANCLLINQHVGPAFRFSPAQIERMETTLKKRVELLRDLTPWDDPNFALDEGWAGFRPYAVRTRPGGTLQGAVVIMNHSPDLQTFRVRLNLPPDWTSPQMTPIPVHIPPRQEGVVHFTAAVPDRATPGLHILTADIDWGKTQLREWSEMMIEVVR